MRAFPTFGGAGSVIQHQLERCSKRGAGLPFCVGSERRKMLVGRKIDHFASKRSSNFQKLTKINLARLHPLLTGFLKRLRKPKGKGTIPTGARAEVFTERMEEGIVFIVLPAIDLLDGKVVRLTQGCYDAVTVYSDAPGQVAERFECDGATWLHVVDLNGAKEGEPRNWEALIAIRKKVRCALQFGGGVRSLPVLERLLSLGIQRVVLGTNAIRTPLLAHEAVKHFGADRIAVAIDVREGRVAVCGWTETEALTPIEVGLRLREAGVQWFIYTDILRDGMLVAPNMDAVAQFAETVKAKVIASGGVSQVEHIRQLKTLQPLGVVGCIIGRALYEGRLSLKDVLAAPCDEG